MSMIERIYFVSGLRNSILETEEHICPLCQEAGVSPDSLIANMWLRQYITTYENIPDDKLEETMKHTDMFLAYMSATYMQPTVCPSMHRATPQ